MSVLWASKISSGACEIDGIGLDPDGNTIAAGVFRDEGPGDIFVVKYDPSGNILWMKPLGSTGDDNAFALAVDPFDGSIIVSGWYAGTVDFGGVTLVSAGDQDMFLVKLDEDGNTLWAKSFGGVNDDGGNEVAINASGMIAVAAMSDGDFTVDGVTFNHGGGARDAFVMTLNSDGLVLMVKPFAGPGSEHIRATAIDDDGNIFVGFEYAGSVAGLTSRGGIDGAAAKISPTGTLLWIVPVGGNKTDNVRGIAADNEGGCYINGQFSGPCVIANLSVPKMGGKGDDYVARLDASGDAEWLVTIAGPDVGIGGELVAVPGGVVVSGMAQGLLKVRRDYEVLGEGEIPDPTAYISRIGSDGYPTWAYGPTVVSGNGCMGAVVAASQDGSKIAHGIYFNGTIDIGGTVMSTPADLDSAVYLYEV